MRTKARVTGRARKDPDQFVTLDHARVNGQDYSVRTIQKFTAIGSCLEQCCFKNARIRDASFGAGREMSEYVECNFDGMHFHHGRGHARFVKCSFRGVDIREWFGQGTELIDCTFSGRLGTAMFFGKIPIGEDRRFLHRERNEFRGNDFSEMKFFDVNFGGGIDLTQQRLPSGPEYLYVADAASAIARLQSGLERWNSNPEARRAALTIAGTFTKIVKAGQQQLFLQPEGWYRMSDKTFPRESLDKLFSLLGGQI